MLISEIVPIIKDKQNELEKTSLYLLDKLECENQLDKGILSKNTIINVIAVESQIVSLIICVFKEYRLKREKMAFLCSEDIDEIEELKIYDKIELKLRKVYIKLLKIIVSTYKEMIK